jgi:Asp-tRNA(Asn)/Glu-tRNA(Gln) amidotransferase C subunit
MSEYTEYEKYQNYLRIQRHIELLNSQRLTEDILEEYMAHLTDIRDVFPDMSYIHPEITDPAFRACAAKCEYHISNLLRRDAQFDQYAYMEFLHSLLYMADHFSESDELSDLMTRMKFQ